MKLLAPVLVIAAAILACRTARAEEFVLAGGGRIVGELLNPDQVPRQDYQIKTAAGVQLTLNRSQVQEVRRRRPEEIEYERIWPRYSDTVEGQWQLAEWCRERTLLSQRERHLKRILELDPEHAQARRALGFFERKGGWTTREEEMKAHGYVLHKGQWRLPQEIELMQEAEAVGAAEAKWSQEIARWRGWLKANRAVAARDNFAKIKDPFAVKALAKALEREPDQQIRKIYIQSLANIGSVAATKIIALRALRDPVEEMRLTCLDHLKKIKNAEALDFFMGRLSSTDNIEVNRAAVALHQFGDPAAIGPLIDALVTTDKVTVPGKDPGQMSVGFSSAGGSGMSMGGGPVIVNRTNANRPVLEALVALAGGPNFGFDTKAWKSWYASQHRFQRELDARRD